MRIAVTGPERSQVISQIEKAFNSQAKKPLEVLNNIPMIIEYAAETYKYENEVNVVFDGSPFDFLSKSEGEGYDDVYEQVAIDSLSNIDYIVVLTENMDSNTFKVYKEYYNLFPEKIKFFDELQEFEITLR